MMISGIIWSIVLALHLLCMAYWVGGGLVVWRSDKVIENSLSGAQGLSLRFQLYARYYRTLWHIVPLSALTGLALLFELGMRVPFIYHLMSLGWMLMTAIFAWVYFRPLRELKRALRMSPETLLRVRNMSIYMALIGILVAFCGGFRYLL